MSKTGIEPITSLEDPIEQADREPFEGRVLGFKVGIFILFAVLLRQLWVLQIVNGEKYSQIADNNSFRVMSIDAPRGVIYDRNHILLVRNKPSYTVSIVPADLPNDPIPVYQRLSTILGVPSNMIKELVEVPPNGKRVTDEFTPVPIKENVDQTIAFTVEERHPDLPGAMVQTEPIRDYLDGSVTSQLLGFVGAISAKQYQTLKNDPKKYTVNDWIGQTGLEATLESYLRGEPGERQMEVDATGREVQSLAVKDSVAGDNVQVTIDIGLQQEFTRIAQKYIQQYKQISIVAMDPSNGQILSLISLPSYDNNLFSQGITQNQLDALLKDPERPMVNHVIADANPPGSIFKIVTASAGLQEGVVSPSTKLLDVGYITVPNPWGGPPAKFVCWLSWGHGWQDVISALADSCDVYFYQVGGGPPDGKWKGLGPDRLAQYAKEFGYGAPTGIDLPGEVSGIIPNEAWKQSNFHQPWYLGDTYNMAIGQGFVTVTPLQATLATVALANGGTVYKPQLVDQITDSQGNVVKSFKPEIMRKLPVDQRWLEVVKDGLRDDLLIGKTPYGTSFTGTSFDSEVPGADIAGKTGTAQYGIPDKDGNMPNHGWYTALAPRNNPKIVITVYLANGSGHTAAQLASELMRAYFHLPPKK